MKIRANELIHIRYENSTGSVTERVVIPLSVPSDTMKAIDVSELGIAEREEMQGWANGYGEYLAAQRQRTYSFEDWVEHTTSVGISPPKWRTFAMSGVSVES